MNYPGYELFFPGYELLALDHLRRTERLRRHWGVRNRSVPRTPLRARARHLLQRSA